MISTRDAFGNALVELGNRYDFVVIDADLSKATKTALFAEKFPQRHFNAGIAEADMMGVAAGMAISGLNVLACSFAMFAACRAYEQIRNSIAYSNLGVKICATHGGLLIGEDGGSHQCIEDISLMRTLPNMTVISPADQVETAASIEAVVNMKTPVYLRMGKNEVANIFNKDSYKFELGKGIQVCDGDDAAIIATGIMLQYALEARKLLEEKGIKARVINIHTIKPIDADIINKAAEQTGIIVTVEDHSVIGGLGSAVADVLCASKPVSIGKIGVQDMFGKSGKPDYLLKMFKMTPQDIAEKVIHCIKK